MQKSKEEEHFRVWYWSSEEHDLMESLIDSKIVLFLKTLCKSVLNFSLISIYEIGE